MNFNLDDPLGDLLSEDDASEDSFAKILRAKPSTPSTATTTDNKAKVSNLFGIEADTPKPQPQQPASKPATPAVAAAAPILKPPSPIIKTPDQPTVALQPAKAPARKGISFDDDNDDDDLFADLGFDPKKPKAARNRTGILDDLLATAAEPTTGKSTPTASRPTTAGSTPAAQLSRQPSTLNLAEKTPPATAAGGAMYAPTGLGRPKTAGSSARPNTDPLGLFGPTKTEPTSAVASKAPSPATRRRPAAGVADWLGADDRSNVAAQDLTFNIPIDTTPAPAAALPQPMQPVQPHFHPPTNSNLTPSAQLFAATVATANTESHAAATAFQQQEAQLLVATQMRQQESALLDMQRRQQAMLQQQEQQFAALLQQQLQRQHALEANIRMQQDRIGAHIGVLMQQPPSSAGLAMPSATETATDQLDALCTPAAPSETLVELRVDRKRLEMENLRLADLCEHSKDNHDRELELMEQSHTKQMDLLRQSADQTEALLRKDLEQQRVSFATKLQQAQADLAATSVKYEKLVADRTAAAATELADQRQRHQAELEQLRSDHVRSTEAMRRSRELEQTVVQDNSNYLLTLQSASGRLETATDDLQTLRSDLEQTASQTAAMRDAQLTAREERVTQQLAAAARERERSGVERTALLELIRSLETKLQLGEQKTSEVEWSLQQQRATLDAERVAFERERKWLRDRMAGDEERVRQRYDDLKHELRVQEQRLEADRVALLAERAKLETMARLQRPMGDGAPAPDPVGKSRVEIDAAVQAAKEVVDQCERERERYAEAQRQCEHQRRELAERLVEAQTVRRALEEQQQQVDVRERTAGARVAACKRVEARLAQRLAAAQRGQTEVAGREQRVAQDRLDVSRERLELQALRRELYKSRCSLCKIGERSAELTEILTRTAGVGGEGEGNLQMPTSELEMRYGSLEENVEGMLEREVNEELSKMNLLDAGMDATSDRYPMDAEMMLSRLDAMEGGVGRDLME